MSTKKIVFKNKKTECKKGDASLRDRVEEWVGYWRANPHRFIIEYLGLPFKGDFQPILFYALDLYTHFIYVASRGLGKSTITLLYCIMRCILYPDTKIVVVAPLRSQSLGFVKKIKEFARKSPNLLKEIKDGFDGIKTGMNDCGVYFENGSQIITKTFGEGSRGERANIVIVDEFAQIKDNTLLNKVFIPMLSDGRDPLYLDLTSKEKLKYIEPNRQLYLSSIRTEAEWSWEYFLTYIDFITNGNEDYGVLSLPYQFGVEAGYIQKSTVEQSFREAPDQAPFLKAEYEAIPVRTDTGSFFKYSDIMKMRDHCQVFVAKSDEEYVEYKDKPEKWQFYVPKLEGELRILSMDVALIESPKNDNTSFWITRLIPNGDRYYKSIVYSDTLHGLNALVQAKRLKQLFYEFECDFVGIDAQGNGRGVADACMKEIYDEARGITYPAWTTADFEDVKTAKRALSPNAVPVMYAIKTSSADKHRIFVNSRDMIATSELHFPVDEQEALDFYNEKHKYYKIDNNDLKNRILNTYVQINMFIFEAINLDTVVSSGYFNLVEKPSRRKDRVMSLCYNLDIVKQKEDEYIALQNQETNSFLDYVAFV